MFPQVFAIVGLVLLVQNICAQWVTGPLNNWHEFVFNVYYILLFLLTAVIAGHFQYVRGGTAQGGR